MYLAAFKKLFVFVKLHLLAVKFNAIFDNEILMMADILLTAKQCLPSKLDSRNTTDLNLNSAIAGRQSVNI